jgi:hypothetical protein
MTHLFTRSPSFHNRADRSSVACRLVGIVGATAIVSAGLQMFGPFSDLSALQLAAGPRATAGTTSAPAAIVMAHTGRQWAGAAAQRQADAASASVMRMAHADNLK